MIRQGTWVRYSHGVIALAGIAATWKQKAMAAALAGGPLAMLTSGAGARLYGLDDYAAHDVVSLAIPWSSRNPLLPGVKVHWTRDLSEQKRHVVDGIPVTMLPLTLTHLATAGHNVEKALDSALRQRRSPVWFRDELSQLCADNVRGAEEVARLLSDRFGTRLPRSWFQRLAKEMLSRTGLTFDDEVPVLDRSGKRIAELDLANVDLKVGVECQSVAFHDTPTDRHNDLNRKRKLRKLGWEIVEVWWKDLDQIEVVVDDLLTMITKVAAA